MITSDSTIKAALADRKKVVKTGSISMGRGRCMGRGSAGASCRGMGRGSAKVRLRGVGRSSVGASFEGMGKGHGHGKVDGQEQCGG